MSKLKYDFLWELFLRMKNLKKCDQIKIFLNLQELRLRKQINLYQIVDDDDDSSQIIVLLFVWPSFINKCNLRNSIN